jgi:NitT/TauT family transport system ATP-binding protein
MTRVLIDNVSVEFARHREAPQIALTNTSLEIEQGEFVCLLGPSGCGKSTLLNVVGGLVDATTGTIRVDGHSVARPGPDRGMVFQNYSLYPWLTVRQNIEFGPKLNRWPKDKVTRIASELIEIVGLGEYADQFPKVLSGGMKQRVAIARALAMEPSVLLMDEPFGALDAQTRTLMQEELIKLARKIPRTVLFITHAVEEAVYLADRVVVMTRRPGRIAEIVDVAPVRAAGGWDKLTRVEEVMEQAPFTELKSRIWRLLREQQVNLERREHA